MVQTVQVQQLTAGGMDGTWYSTMTIEKQRTIAKELVNYFNDRTYEREYLASRVFGWTTNAEITNGRWVMFGLLVRVPHPPAPRTHHCVSDVLSAMMHRHRHALSGLSLPCGLHGGSLHARPYPHGPL